MKEELQGKLVEILTSVQTAVGKASDFAMAELPDIAQSYVAFGRAYAVVHMVSLLLLFGVGMFVALRYGFLNKAAIYPEGHWNAGSWCESRVAAAAIGTLGAAGIAGLLFGSSKAYLLVWFAPKVWLLKEIATLLK